jgi:hypothetical protein
MSRSRSILLTAGLALAAIYGCRQIYSVHPLFRDADLIVEPNLVGMWSPSAKPGDDRWVFLRPDTAKRDYTLGVTEPALARTIAGADFGRFLASDSLTKARLRRDPAARARRSRDSVTVARLACDSAGAHVFDVQVGRLAGLVFLDIAPSDAVGCGSRVGPGLMPTHWFWKASLDSAQLTLVPLDADWLGKMIDSSRVGLAHETEGNRLVLTAATADLQRVVTEFARDTAAFPEKGAIEFRRVR